MSAKFKAVSALDDRVARMSDLRLLVDEISKLVALQQVQIDELRAAIGAPMSETVPTDSEGSE